MVFFCCKWVNRRRPRPGLLARAGGLWLAGCLAGFAQEFHVRNWHMEDGLPDGTVTSLAQTPEGYLWAGTPQGLVRFDGAQFKTFAPGPATGLTEAHIAALLVDRGGGLWVAGVAGSLARYERGRFRTVSPARGTGGTGFARDDAGRSTRWMWGRVSELAEDADRTVWLVYASRELLRWRDGEIQVATATNGLPAAEIDALCSDLEGQLWLAADRALYCRREGRWRPVSEVGPLGGRLPRLATARGGGVWVAAPRESWILGGGMVRRLAGDQWFGGLEPTPWTPNSLRSQVTSLLEDRAGRVWLGTLWGGVFYADAAGRWQRVTTEGAFSQAVITCLFEDRQGAVWAGTLGEGLHRITRRPVTMLTLPAPATDHIITTSAIARDGAVWVGTDGAGAFCSRGGPFTRFASNEGLTNQHVCSILEDRRTNLWAGTWGGLFRIQAGRFARVTGPPELDRAVLALFEDRAGDLWIGTPGGPVCHRDGEFKVHHLPTEGGDADIRAFAEDAAGGLWVGTIGQGLFHLSGDQAVCFGPAQGFDSLNARSLFIDGAGTLWIGSEGGGLYRFRNGRFTGYSSRDGLPCDTIGSITSDASGKLWMGSNNGIFGCWPSLFENFTRDRSPALLGQRLGLEEGLGSRSCSGSGQPVISKSSDGRLWFPNMRGLAVFDPRQDAGESLARVVLVESVLADGLEISAGSGGELRVPSTARRFELHYTAPDLATPQALRFRYRLEGMDSEWVEAGTRRVAYYSQLPPGRYQFRVMAGGAEGRWEESPTALAIQVVPRWWERRWVQVLAGMVWAGGAAGAMLLNERRKLRRRLERLEMQQALEGERRRIARDLHDDLGARLTEIVLLGELAKRGAQTPATLQEQVSGITQKVRQLVTAMEDVVWTINPKNDSLPSLAAYLCDHTERFLAPAHLSCRLDAAENLPPTPVTAHARHNLLLAVKEALNNAARHAAATQVRLRIGLVDGTLQVTVEDDGRGFNPNQLARAGNGLLNMRNRLEAINGRAEIQSEPGKGTRVSFGLPLAGLGRNG